MRVDKGSRIARKVATTPLQHFRQADEQSIKNYQKYRDIKRKTALALRRSGSIKNLQIEMGVPITGNWDSATDVANDIAKVVSEEVKKARGYKDAEVEVTVEVTLPEFVDNEELMEDIRDEVNEEERSEIYDRMANMQNYDEKSKALKMLEITLNSDATANMDTKQLMVQFALQFTGFDDDEVKGINLDKIFTGDESKILYSTASGNSFDTYDDCSGFVQELYKIFLDVDLGWERESKEIVYSGSVDNQFTYMGEEYLTETSSINVEDLNQGDLIYYDNGSDDPKRNAWHSDHVVMYMGNGWVIEESFLRGGVVIGQLKEENVVGYTNDIINRETR